jgi:hypothetical protein
VIVDDANAELASAISLQGFEPVAWRGAKIDQRCGSVKLLHLRESLDGETR